MSQPDNDRQYRQCGAHSQEPDPSSDQADGACPTRPPSNQIIDAGNAAAAETLLEAIPDLVFAHDLEGRLLAVNTAVTRILGYGCAEVVGRLTTEFLRQDQPARFIKEYLEPLINRGSFEGTAVVLAKDGTEHWLECRAGLIRPSGGAAFVIGSGRDVTQRVREGEKLKALQQQLAELGKRRALATMTGGLAHEFNNILSVIMGNAELAKIDLHPWSPSSLFLEEILQAALRARDVIRQLLQCSSMEQSDRKPLYLQTLVEDALRVLTDKLPAGVHIGSELADQTSAVLADPTEIRQLLLQLGANAIRAMAKSGGRLLIAVKEVMVSAEQAAGHLELKPGAHLQLKVADEGCGIAEADLAQIFDPYFTTSPTGLGNGLGLAAVRGIVANHQAAILVESCPGCGTTFTIYFPSSDQVPDQWAKDALGRVRGAEKILLVDNEDALVDIGRQVLDRAGYRVVATNSPKRALELFQASPDDFDLVITDLTMTEMPGDHLAQALRAIRPEQRIIIYSGFSSSMVRERCICPQIDAFLEKPVSRNLLAAAVRRVLDQVPAH